MPCLRRSFSRVRGFTFIELLIYAGIFSTMVGAIVYLTRTVHETRARVRTSIVLQSDLRFALARTLSYVRSADWIMLPTTTTGMTLETAHASSSPGYHPTFVQLMNGIVQVTRGASSTLPLTSSAIQITELTFQRTTTTPTAVRVTISGKLRNGVGPTGVPQTITGAAVIRR